MRVQVAGEVGGGECRDREQDKFREEGRAGAGRTSQWWGSGISFSRRERTPVGSVTVLAEALMNRTLKQWQEQEESE